MCVNAVLWLWSAALLLSLIADDHDLNTYGVELPCEGPALSFGVKVLEYHWCCLHEAVVADLWSKGRIRNCVVNHFSAIYCVFCETLALLRFSCVVCARHCVEHNCFEAVVGETLALFVWGLCDVPGMLMEGSCPNFQTLDSKFQFPKFQNSKVKFRHLEAVILEVWKLKFGP